MFEKLLRRITFTGKSKRYLKQIEPLLHKINKLGEEYVKWSNEELQAKMHTIRRSVRESRATLDEVLPEVFALTREASFRILGKKHFDEQILGGITMYKGKIAEMKTGEGKTLMSSLPIILHALKGKGVHVITVNDYLTARDHMLLKPLYDFFDISSGHITNDTRNDAKYAIYLKDITYCTSSRLAFDYLESNLKDKLENKYRFTLYAIIIDEADNIKLDEARVPLIISSNSNKTSAEYAIIDRVAKELREYEHYIVNHNSKTAFFTKEGLNVIEEFANRHLNIAHGKLFSYEHIHHFHAFSNMLRAHAVMQLDKNYAIVNNEIKVIDEATGRIAEGKKYSNGMHQAIEAKHGVKISENTTITAFITYIKFINQYKHIGGMTGTGMTEANEFQEFYNLDVIQIPTHNPNQRIDHAARLYRTKDVMWNGIVQLISEKHTSGQPVLVGTGSVADSETLSAKLQTAGIQHNVLNAKNHTKEAHIIAQAGRLGAVTVSTKMAGRGVDILLGGNPEMHRDNLVQNEYESEKGLLERINRIVDRERKKVRELGGLCVIMAGTLETTKDEQQLAGRAGRQGDPGESYRFSALDEEFVKSATEGTSHLLNLAFPDDSVYIQGSGPEVFIGDIQAGQQAKGYEIIKHINLLDTVVQQQRLAIYNFRDYIMVTDQIKHIALKIISCYLNMKKTEELQEICENYKIKYSNTGSDSIFSRIFKGKSRRDGILEAIMARLLEILTGMEAEEVRSTIQQKLDNLHEILINQNEDLKRSAPLASIEQENLFVTYDHKSYAAFQDLNVKMAEELMFSLLPRRKEKTRKSEFGTSFAKLMKNAGRSGNLFNPFEEGSKLFRDFKINSDQNGSNLNFSNLFSTFQGESFNDLESKENENIFDDLNSKNELFNDSASKEDIFTEETLKNNLKDISQKLKEMIPTEALNKKSAKKDKHTAAAEPMIDDKDTAEPMIDDELAYYAAIANQNMQNTELTQTKPSIQITANSRIKIPKATLFNKTPEEELDQLLSELDILTVDPFKQKKDSLKQWKSIKRKSIAQKTNTIANDLNQQTKEKVKSKKALKNPTENQKTAGEVEIKPNTKKVNTDTIRKKNAAVDKSKINKDLRMNTDTIHKDFGVKTDTTRKNTSVKKSTKLAAKTKEITKDTQNTKTQTKDRKLNKETQNLTNSLNENKPPTKTTNKQRVPKNTIKDSKNTMKTDKRQRIQKQENDTTEKTTPKNSGETVK